MKLICVLLTTFALGATPAFSNPPPPRAKNIPECELVKTKDGREMCAYTLEQWISVLKADSLISHHYVMIGKLEEKVTLLEGQKIDFQKQIRALTDNNKLLIQGNDKLRADFLALDKKYQYERVKPRWGSPVAWTVAAVSTAVLAGFVLKETLD
jgi:hypothetical protein